MHTYFQIYSSILFKLINYENITHISKFCTLKRDTFVTAFSIPVLVISHFAFMYAHVPTQLLITRHWILPQPTSFIS